MLISLNQVLKGDIIEICVLLWDSFRRALLILSDKIVLNEGVTY